jgi:RecA-family ATPase
MSHNLPQTEIARTLAAMPGFDAIIGLAGDPGLVPDLRDKNDRPQVKPPELINGYKILTTDYPPPVFLFDGLLHNGLTLLAGRPKVGKSWLALQLAIDAALGRPGLAKFGCDGATGVLYFALEESEGRTNNRMKRFIDSESQTAIQSGNIDFGYKLLPLLGGGVEQIDAALSAKNCGLVVIDTLIRAMGAQKRGRNADAMAEDYAVVEPLQALAQKHKVAIVVVAHTRKMSADYSLDKVAGTTGLTAGADSVWVLDKTPKSTLLTIQGRDMGDAEFALHFDHADYGFGWTVVGTGEEVMRSESRQQIVELLKEEGALTPKEIATTLKKNYNTTRNLLKKMADTGEILKAGAKYTLEPIPYEP